MSLWDSHLSPPAIVHAAGEGCRSAAAREGLSAAEPQVAESRHRHVASGRGHIKMPHLGSVTVTDDLINPPLPDVEAHRGR